LAETVDITNRYIDVYPDEKFSNTKPRRGEKLNNPAIL
jgi:hypothetical protein